MSLEFFDVQMDHGIAVVTFDRRPVNAFSKAVYEELIILADRLGADRNVRVVVFTAPQDARAWIGGADLNDFAGLDYQSRLTRYELVNQAMARFFELPRPVIAAINVHAIGAGMSFASLCDLRIASEEAFFSMPEVDRGTTSGGGAQFSRLGMPAARIREILFTGRRFTVDELKDTGFFNYVVPKANVLEKALELARIIAGKSVVALEATKICCNAVERMSPAEGQAFTQEYSARLTAGEDSREGVRAFLEKRVPVYRGLS